MTKRDATQSLALWTASFLAATALSSVVRGEGGIATDGSLGLRQTLGGANVDIPQSLGKTVGANLFHSFQYFNVAPGQTVTFQENDVGSLDNVIARVTGGSVSDIEGALRSTPGGHADFYLINPAGVLFGDGASLDVAGDFHASAADSIRFKDGAEFAAVRPDASGLSAAAPAAFGFSAVSAANNSLLKLDGADLAVHPGKTLDLAGGEIRIENGAKLTAQAGEIRLAARQGAGEIGLERDADGHLPLPADAPDIRMAGDIGIRDSVLDVSGDEGGRIGLWGKELTVTGLNSGLFANSESEIPTGPEGGVELRGQTFLLDGAAISLLTRGQGYADGVNVTMTGDAKLQGGARISAVSAQPSADRGPGVNVKTGRDLRLEASTIDVTTLGGGSANNLNLRIGGNFTLNDGAKITSFSTGVGRSGAVRIDAAGNLALMNGSEIKSNALGSRDASFISIRTGGELALSGAGTKIGSATLEGGSGNVGRVEINAEGDVSVRNGAAIIGGSDSIGKTGSILFVTSGNLILSNGGSLSSVAASTAGNNGGDIDVTGGLLVLQSGVVRVGTVAANRVGGTVLLNLKGLLADGDNLIAGGNRFFAPMPGIPGWNILQAAAPNGIAGIIQSTAPQLNLSGALLGLGQPQFGASNLGQNYCARSGSALTHAGQNGSPRLETDLPEY
jgi:filamentous hemagglutinin family protein